MVRHASVGSDLSRAEWEAAGTHVVDNIPAGQVLMSNGSTIIGVTPTGVPRYAAIIFTLGDGLNAINPANEPDQWLEIPFNCSITSAKLTADDTIGNFQIDIWKSGFADF